MPLYEYQCKTCGLRFERRQSFSEAPITECPDCGGQVIRLIQPAGIIFKGSGFYVTDHRSASPTATPGTRKEDKEHTAAAASSKEPSEAKAPATSAGESK